MNSTNADLIVYDNLDCSGTPVGTVDMPAEMGCQSSGADSFNVQCIDGEFVEPLSPATNIYYYQASDALTCPVSGVTPSDVYSYPCGTCIYMGNNTFISYACDSLTVAVGFYTDATCSGDATDTTTVGYVGCANNSDGVIVTECDMSKGEIGDSKEKPSVDIKAHPAIIQSVRDAAHAMVKEAVASAWHMPM